MDNCKGNIDGVEAARQIRTFDVPVIYLTAYSDLRASKGWPEPAGYL